MPLPAPARLLSRASGTAHTAGDTARRLGTVAAALAQVAVPAVARDRIGRNAGEGTSLVQPVPWAFGIWGPIFAASGGYAAHQAGAGRGSDPVLRRAGWPLAAAFTGNALWQALVASGRTTPAQGVIVAIGGSAQTGARRVAALELGGRVGTAQRAAVALPAGLLAGWTTAATAVSLGSAALDDGRVPAAARRPLATALVLALAGVAAAEVERMGGRRSTTAVAYAASSLWALMGIGVQQRRDAPAVAAAALAGAAPVAAALARGPRPR